MNPKNESSEKLQGEEEFKTPLEWRLEQIEKSLDSLEEEAIQADESENYPFSLGRLIGTVQVRVSMIRDDIHDIKEFLENKNKINKCKICGETNGYIFKNKCINCLEQESY